MGRGRIEFWAQNNEPGPKKKETKFNYFDYLDELEKRLKLEAQYREEIRQSLDGQIKHFFEQQAAERPAGKEVRSLQAVTALTQWVDELYAQKKITREQRVDLEHFILLAHGTPEEIFEQLKSRLGL